MNSKNKWSIEADYLQACNCDYGCPCEFSAPPTPGYCEGMGAWQIKQGHYGDVRLDRLGFAFVAHWPKALHEGNGTICLLIDENADSSQREALLQIASGKAGMPFEILVTTCPHVLEPRFLPFRFNFDGLNSSVSIGDAVNVRLGPILNPVTKQPESVRIEHGTGFVFQRAECASAEEFRASVGELKFTWPKKAAFVTQIKYGN